MATERDRQQEAELILCVWSFHIHSLISASLNSVTGGAEPKAHTSAVPSLFGSRDWGSCETLMPNGLRAEAVMLALG